MTAIAIACIIVGLTLAGIAGVLYHLWQRDVILPIRHLRNHMAGRNTGNRELLEIRGAPEVQAVMLEYKHMLETLRQSSSPVAAKQAVPPDIGHRIRQDIRLACEHLESMQLLIQVAMTHQQVVPPSVLNKLAFVERHLKTLEGDVVRELGIETRADEGELNLPAQRVPRDPLAGAEYHVSPYGR